MVVLDVLMILASILFSIGGLLSLVSGESVGFGAAVFCLMLAAIYAAIRANEPAASRPPERPRPEPAKREPAFCIQCGKAGIVSVEMGERVARCPQCHAKL